MGLAGDGGTPTDDAPDEDLSVPNASPDVQKTLRAMAGATPRERRWVATREREKGNELFKAREYRSAVDSYALAIALDPESAAAHANRAAARMKLKMWEAAVEDCTAALAIEPGHLKALARRAACRLESGTEGAAPPRWRIWKRRRRSSRRTRRWDDSWRKRAGSSRTTNAAEGR